ncbi:CopG family transcriptional regulator [Prochlorococcus sp. MIT 1223]|uniref:CopG family transcriptional regulator n=1 Tax=Prochlorococcus sp. MIT 1223 TaxID=3096217 RepID=UPI002A74CA3A|nr:CopG family transcriptional regulator [Prochlorococcus sp. MIT 1223]
MNSRQSSGDEVLFPVTISIKAGTAKLLSQMAMDMGISIDDVLSVLAEDAAIDLENDLPYFHKDSIPDKCSKDDLLKALE